MKRVILTISILLVLSISVLSQVKKLEIRMHNGAYYDLFAYSNNNDTINITQFEPWVEVRDLIVSPDSTYFFYRYKREGKAYRLVTYKLESLKKVSEVIPGFGGHFEWNIRNQILHSWGCGTNCANLRVYNSALKEIFFTLSSCGFIYSADKTRVAQLSMLADQIWIFDLNTLNKNKIPNGYTKKINHNLNWDYYKFSTNDEIVIDSIPSHNIDLTKIKWVKLDPETTGQFYIERQHNQNSNL
ncbi:MAG: hypothetical protein N4A72_17335 [Bacteroidales bacterium]|jgi:hypothetical protein|nr:hypothetical protein [Bacteroidales bacterium]